MDQPAPELGVSLAYTATGGAPLLLDEYMPGFVWVGVPVVPGTAGYRPPDADPDAAGMLPYCPGAAGGG